MKTLAIIGASSRIGIETIQLALETTDAHLNLFLRNKQKLGGLNLPADRVSIFEGDARDAADLEVPISSADMVLVSLEGPMEQFAQASLEAMKKTGVKRLVFVASLGILDEVPGEFGAWIQANMFDYLAPYIRAMTLIEASDVDYTILRPGELTNDKGTAYQTTGRDELFKGRYTNRQAVAAVVVDILKDFELYSRQNIGVNNPF